MSSAITGSGPARDPRNQPDTDPDLVVRMPPTNTGLLVAAGVCLLIPLVALLWVGSYAKATPRLGGIPFFFWYQFAWVFVTSALTYTAHRLVLAARGRGGRGPEDAGAPPDAPPDVRLGDRDRVSSSRGHRS